ncbi:MAG TPA: helix-turn-helix domain-containing protein [Myxococcota bacterium]|nr:helix-turn-helix domain-containing protein [Myxococcota bacterium]
MSRRSQAERSAATVEALERAARALFSGRGFEATSIDDIAARAGVAKGAFYHHFAAKEEIFVRVLDGVQAELAALPVPAASRRIADPLERIADAVLRWLLAASEPERKRILLVDGPAVIGWQRWREIDAKYFGAGARVALAAVLGERASAREVDALAHLLLGAVMEGALVCASAPDARRAAREVTAALRRLLAGLRE